MKARMLALTLVLMILLGATAQAAELMRKPSAFPTLTFSGTTATCAATVRGDNSTDNVYATMKLWKGSTCLNTWTAHGSGQVTLSKVAVVSHGQTYKLTVDYTVNGVAQPQESTTSICP